MGRGYFVISNVSFMIPQCSFYKYGRLGSCKVRNHCGYLTALIANFISFNGDIWYILSTLDQNSVLVYLALRRMCLDFHG